MVKPVGVTLSGLIFKFDQLFFHIKQLSKMINAES